MDCIKERRLLRKYGLSWEDYQVLLVKQEGVCAICREVCATGRVLAVDHDHQTGAVRGLLCARCNSVLGMAQDNPAFLERAISYLETATAIPA